MSKQRGAATVLDLRGLPKRGGLAIKGGKVAVEERAAESGWRAEAVAVFAAS